MQVLLPWPEPALSPNARSRTWHKAARAKKAYRRACGVFAMAAGFRKIIADRLAVTVTFHPPSALAMDDDNTIARFKAGRDGIADVVGVDDGKWDVSYVFGKPMKQGGVLVAIEVAA